MKSPNRTPSTAGSRAMQSTAELLQQAKNGDEAAAEQLFERQRRDLHQWARGRLPRWARATLDTVDLVQEALFQAFRRMDRLDGRRGALQAYLRTSIRNRITDEVRCVRRRPVGEAPNTLTALGPSPYDVAVEKEQDRRYKAALRRMKEGDRELVVGALELGYTYEQLALATGRVSAEAARIAVRRALTRLSHELDNEDPHGRTPR